MGRERRRSEPYLTEELITEILSWLPVTSLLRFRCVSNSFKTLISHPDFIKLHHHRSSTSMFLTLHQFRDPNPFIAIRPLSIFLHNPPSIEYDYGDSSLPWSYKYSVLGSCNGLVCLLDVCAEWSHHSDYWILFWNPATRLRSSSPLHFDLTGSHWLQKCCFLGKFGFGYDKFSDTYKVVALVYSTLPNNYDAFEFEKTWVKVYTMRGSGSGSGSGHCTREIIQRFPAYPGAASQREGVFLSGSGTLNWLAIRDRYTFSVDGLLIVSLDLRTETYKQFSLPPALCPGEIPHHCDFDPILKAFDDCLCLSCDNYNSTHFVMWQMREFGVEKSWTQFVKVSYEQLGVDVTDQWLQIQPLCMSENGDVLMLQTNRYEIFLYSRKDNKVLQRFASEIISAMYHVQSLVPPF